MFQQPEEERLESVTSNKRANKKFARSFRLWSKTIILRAILKKFPPLFQPRSNEASNPLKKKRKNRASECARRRSTFSFKPGQNRET